MSMLSSLLEKPWEQGMSPQIQVLDPDGTRRVGLRILLTVISVLFFLFIVAFLIRSQYPDWQALAQQASQPLFNKDILWLNSAYLLMASICLQWARVVARKKQTLSMYFGVFLGGLFSVAFILGQWLLWQQLYGQGFTVNVNPALSFFYLLTGMHALHVGMGLVAWLVVVFAAVRASLKLSKYVELCAIYWHFLLALWAVLFMLLVSKPETYDAIIAFCGLGPT